MQVSFFDGNEDFHFNKPIRLIEFFSGYGSQALALKELGVKFEHWRICEWAIKSIQAYKDNHFSDDTKDYSQHLTTRPDVLGVAVENLENLRIRKLTPRECFRLMAVRDENFEMIAKNQSNASLYHLAGDSIVVAVLVAILGQFVVGFDFDQYVQEFYKQIKENENGN